MSGDFMCYCKIIYMKFVDKIYVTVNKRCCDKVQN